MVNKVQTSVNRYVYLSSGEMKIKCDHDFYDPKIFQEKWTAALANNILSYSLYIKIFSYIVIFRDPYLVIVKCFKHCAKSGIPIKGSVSCWNAGQSKKKAFPFPGLYNLTKNTPLSWGHIFLTLHQETSCFLD